MLQTTNLSYFCYNPYTYWTFSHPGPHGHAPLWQPGLLHRERRGGHWVLLHTPGDVVGCADPHQRGVRRLHHHNHPWKGERNQFFKVKKSRHLYRKVHNKDYIF